MNSRLARLICRWFGHVDPCEPPLYGHIVRGCRRCGVLGDGGKHRRERVRTERQSA